jgi:hypothetical protein
MHEADFAHGLWKEVDWREMRQYDKKDLERAIFQLIEQFPGLTREALWEGIVQHRFMRYLKSEFTRMVQHLLDTQKIISPTQRRTKQLNDTCQLYLPPS